MFASGLFIINYQWINVVARHITGILHLLHHLYWCESLLQWGCHIILLARSCKTWRWVTLDSWIWPSWKALARCASWQLIQSHQRIVCFSDKNVVNFTLRFFQKFKIIDHLLLISFSLHRMQLIIDHSKLLGQVLIHGSQFVQLSNGILILLNDNSAAKNIIQSCYHWLYRLLYLLLYWRMRDKDVFWLWFSVDNNVALMQVLSLVEYEWSQRVVCLRGN